MEIVGVERADHHGIVAGIIRDLGIIELVNERLGVDSDEKVSSGEAVAAMIINGLGFTDRPLSLAPQFFANCPLDLLFDKQISAKELNRFKLGRTLDRIFTYGCDTLFAELSMNACRQEGVDTRFGHLDTTTFSLTGEYLPDTAENVVLVTNGYSKDNRPDLKQVVQELMVSQDGNIPMLCKIWDGNTSDDEIFQQRSAALVESFKSSEGPQILIADSKLYNKANMPNLSHLAFVTRVPDSIGLVEEKIAQAISEGTWERYDEKRVFRTFAVEHYNVHQRWTIVKSSEAENRAKASIDRQSTKEHEAIKKELFHLQAQRFSCIEDAKFELEKKVKKWKFHQLDQMTVVEHKIFKAKGRPKAGAIADKVAFQVIATVTTNQDAKKALLEQKSCFVLATNVGSMDLKANDVISAYVKQGSTIERGFRFLKEPQFFASSLFLKKPSRIQGLLTIMTFALLVYSIAERRMRKALKETKQTLPNQINQPTDTPTLRWLFQQLDGINRVIVRMGQEIHYVWQGINELRKKILSLFGKKVMSIYQISTA
jgi:transposase